MEKERFEELVVKAGYPLPSVDIEGGCGCGLDTIIFTRFGTISSYSHSEGRYISSKLEELKLVEFEDGSWLVKNGKGRTILFCD